MWRKILLNFCAQISIRRISLRVSRMYFENFVLGAAYRKKTKTWTHTLSISIYLSLHYMQKIIFVKSDKTVLSHFKLKHTIYLYSYHILKIYSFDLINNQPYHISNKNTLSIYIHIQKSYILSLSKQISPIIFHNLNQSPQLLFNMRPSFSL